MKLKKNFFNDNKCQTITNFFLICTHVFRRSKYTIRQILYRKICVYRIFYERLHFSDTSVFPEFHCDSVFLNVYFYFTLVMEIRQNNKFGRRPASTDWILYEVKVASHSRCDMTLYILIVLCIYFYFYLFTHTYVLIMRTLRN